jgi:hypothetical protein
MGMTRAFGIVAFAAFSLFAASASAARPDSSTAQGALDAWKRASGGARWDTVRDVETVGVITGDKSRGVSREIDDLRRGRYVSHAKIDGEDGGAGFDGTRYWTTDASGQVRIEGGGSQALAVNAAYRARRAYWRTMAAGEQRLLLPGASENSRAFDVVRVTPQGGTPFDLWFDRKTHLLGKMVENRGPYTETERYSDYRSVKGLLFAYRTEIVLGGSRFALRTTRLTLLSHARDATFAVPPAPLPDYAFARGVDHVDVPFELWNNHIYVRVSIGAGPPRLMMFDTGATGLIDSKAAADLGLMPRGTTAVMGSGTKTLTGATLKIPQIAIGGVRFRNLSFDVIDYSEQRRVEGVTASIGILGYEIPKRLVTRIDYEHRILTLTKPQAWREPVGATALDFEFVSQLVQVTASIDGRPGRFVLDTGSRASVLLLSDFVERNGFKNTIPTSEKLIGWGLGGPVKAPTGRAHALELGGFMVRDPIVGLLPPAGLPPVDGNIGGAILRRFEVTFDYAHQKVWLKPNAALAAPDPADLSGLWINRDEHGFRIVDVEPHSPGEAAELRVGDLIVAVNGAAADGLALSDVRDQLKTPGAIETFDVQDKLATRRTRLSLPAH